MAALALLLCARCDAWRLLMPNFDDPDDVFFMHLALHQAAQAYSQAEVPVGAVLVSQGRVVGQGYNQTRSLPDPSAHAEIQALRQAALTLGNFRLPGSCLYVTVEPCAMCLGALMHARVERVVFGAFEPKAGRLCSHPWPDDPAFNHRIRITAGVCEPLARQLMQQFFQARRRAATPGLVGFRAND